MQQLSQKLKDGNLKTIEVPCPSLSSGCILVRNHYSLISAGTEGSTVKTARKSLISKVKERPQQVKQVIDVLKTQGPVQTYRAVMKKLDALSPLGYSCVGEIIRVSRDVSQFEVGDYVACGGLTACHAEVVSVPVNLCVKIDLNSAFTSENQLKMAAYNTLGAIAMQGVRQADMRLGENCAVIGLGLLGQLTCLLLRASGIQVVGLDINEAAVLNAEEYCADVAYVMEGGGVGSSISDYTQGLGCDCVIITAGTNSLGPINFAGEIARKRGRVVVVGAVPTGFDRDPHYYRKELELRMSCSYGPGRYDLEYEEKGIDYPSAYVRWTENRNMVAFQELIRTGKIDLGFLTTHEFALEDAPKAYDMIVSRDEPFLGILIKYDVDKKLERKRIQVNQVTQNGKLGVAFIGAGSYAQGSLLPNLPNSSDVVRKAVMTSSGTSSRSVAERFKFEYCTSEKDEIFKDDSINTLFISTRHDSHAEYVIDGLKNNKNVFVEKPLCLQESELEKIKSIFAGDSGVAVPNVSLMVGFNRRFAPLVDKLKQKMGDGAVSMIYRVNAGAIPADSWIQDIDIGGGRIVGEVCHFIDFFMYISGSRPKTVYAASLPDPNHLNDTLSITVTFEDGSIGTVNYFANGSKSLAKEYIEVYQGGTTTIIKDFKEIEIYGRGKPYRKKLLSQDKGQKKMINLFLQSLIDGGKPVIALEDIFSVTKATFAVLESIRTRQMVQL